MEVDHLIVPGQAGGMDALPLHQPTETLLARTARGSVMSVVATPAAIRRPTASVASQRSRGLGCRGMKQSSSSGVIVYMGIRYRGRETAHDIAPKPENRKNSRPVAVKSASTLSPWMAGGK